MFFSKAAYKALVLSSLTFSALGAVLVEELKAAPHGWTLHSTPAADHQVSLSIGLQQQNVDQFYSKLESIAHPNSEEYGQWMDKEDVEAMLKPTAASKAAVVSWLKSNGVTDVKADDSWVDFAAPVAKANKLLSANFQHYHREGVVKLRTLKYSVPDELAPHIDLVTPATYFGKTKAFRPIQTYPKVEARAVDANCSRYISPLCLRELYNTVGYTPDPKSGSTLGFGSFLNQSARYSDLAQYEKFFNLPSQNFTTILINGGVDNQTVDPINHGEANLDVQNLVGVGAGLPIRQFITGGSPPFVASVDEPTDENEPYLPYYKYLLAKDPKDLPLVISNSYGEEESTVPKAYALRVCNMIAQLGARGITVLESSGDLGVGAGCKLAGTNTTRFEPIFPATCPYLTSVGGTQSISPEIAWVGSSGGFSDYFKQPAYQATAVNTYLTKYLPAATKKYFSKYADFTGRGFPDVSAHSVSPDYAIVDEGQLVGSGGTSAASPVTAAIVGLLNDARLRAGKPQLGFLNPFLYSKGFKGLTDVTGGASIGCNGFNTQSGQAVPGAGIVPGAFWNATVGWDPSTGLGLPDFQKLKALVL